MMLRIRNSVLETVIVAFMAAFAVAFAVSLGTGGQALAASAADASPSLTSARGGNVLSTMAAKKNLRKAGMKFDLQNGKKRYVYALVRGAGKVKYSIKMTKFKVKATGNGRKKATFDITWNLEDKVTSGMAKKILRALATQGYSWDYMESGYHMFFVDYVTGRNLEDPAYSGGFKLVRKKTVNNKRTKKYYGPDDSWFYLGQTWTLRVTVTFPAYYQNLCVGMGCGKKFGYSYDSADWAYIGEEESGRTFYQTSWLKKCKDNFHLKRIK